MIKQNRAIPTHTDKRNDKRNAADTDKKIPTFFFKKCRKMCVGIASFAYAYNRNVYPRQWIHVSFLLYP